MCVRVYVCACVFMYVSMYVCMYACIYVSMHVFMHVCMFVCMYVCIFYVFYVCMYMHTERDLENEMVRKTKFLLRLNNVKNMKKALLTSLNRIYY
jgi:hypothetical protein